MNPDELKYTEAHEWVGFQDGAYVVGITDFAQQELGEITHVDLPEEGAKFQQGDAVAAVDSVKAWSEVYAPVSGVVVAVNDALDTEPELVNKDPYGAGWFFKMGDVNVADLDALMDAAAYQEFLNSQDH